MLVKNNTLKNTFLPTESMVAVQREYSGLWTHSTVKDDTSK